MEIQDAEFTTIFTDPPKSPRKPRPPRRRFGVFASILLVLLALWAGWSWGFCRFYVGPGRMAIITAKSGDPLPPDQILAKPGQKGVLEDVLGEGRHIWNPLFYDWEIVDALFIPPGKVGVVTSLVGDPLPPGELSQWWQPSYQAVWAGRIGSYTPCRGISFALNLATAACVPYQQQ